MIPDEFRALSPSQSLEEIAAALAGLADDTATRQETMIAGGLATSWSAEREAEYRALVAASAAFTHAVAVGRDCQTSKRQLPRWIADLVGQSRGHWLTAPRAPSSTEVAHVDAT